MADYDDRYRSDTYRRDEERSRRGGDYGGRDYGGRNYSGSSGLGDRDPRDHDRGRRDLGDYGRAMRDDMRTFRDDRGSGGYGAWEDRDYGRNEGRDDQTGRGYGSRDDRMRDYYGARGTYSGLEDRRGGYGERYGRESGGYNYAGGRSDSYGEGGRGWRGGAAEDRGFFSRAGDEIASWFGSDEAERRRERDAHAGDEGAQHHRGRGPRNYTRSDSRIVEDVNDRLTDDFRLDASDIDVSAENGEVTLSGHVNSRQDKRRAEDLAESVSGVRHVQNNLRVRDRSSWAEGMTTSGGRVGSADAATTPGSRTGSSAAGTGTAGSSGTTATGTTGSGVGAGGSGGLGSTSTTR
ncbi:BON domain-containing protein [Rhodospirillum centenum]|uniref:Phospholipid-binding domain protein, putative n=1 Tax=Rhodospirillum centenum (strain ATCC 51521 / SW) TaxID=414684 RepID=B6IPP3_RHOCS|nr:BON domain-containing protein [Rhodospirillum centenum]ACI99745.1 phospholipid-binding domain protein, putative [Rhodospirillum centenum SW]